MNPTGMMKLITQQSTPTPSSTATTATTTAASQFEITSISCKTGNNENEEKSTRFRRVKIDTDKNSEVNNNDSSSYTRGRWKISDYIDDSNSKKEAPATIATTNDSTPNEIIVKTQCKNARRLPVSVCLLISFFYFKFQIN